MRIFKSLTVSLLCAQVPGTGFGQVDGTWHFRVTILPSEEDISQVVEALRRFHEDFVERYTE